MNEGALGTIVFYSRYMQFTVRKVLLRHDLLHF